jgi:hypothetical protein
MRIALTFCSIIDGDAAATDYLVENLGDEFRRETGGRFVEQQDGRRAIIASAMRTPRCLPEVAGAKPERPATSGNSRARVHSRVDAVSFEELGRHPQILPTVKLAKTNPCGT